MTSAISQNSEIKFPRISGAKKFCEPKKETIEVPKAVVSAALQLQKPVENVKGLSGHTATQQGCGESTTKLTLTVVDREWSLITVH